MGLIGDRYEYDRINRAVNNKKVKPPIGLIPKRLWLSMRFNDIKSAIERYMADNHTIPIEWIEEYNELADLIER